MSAMKRLFQVMSEKKASDIFLSVGSPINIKINGVAMPVNQTVLNADAVRTLLYEVLNEHQITEYEKEMELNTAVSLEGVGAFRISAMRQKGTPAVVVRFIPGDVPKFDTLGLPDVLKARENPRRWRPCSTCATSRNRATS
jgi:twitching motility protein PilU